VTEHLVGVAEIAQLLGVTRQRVNALASRPSFPKPEAVLTAGRIWRRSDIEEWARQAGRALKWPPDTSAKPAG
jgi:predicted DNA-binding transcriptional regulator AlpA